MNNGKAPSLGMHYSQLTCSFCESAPATKVDPSGRRVVCEHCFIWLLDDYEESEWEE